LVEAGPSVGVSRPVGGSRPVEEDEPARWRGWADDDTDGPTTADTGTCRSSCWRVDTRARAGFRTPTVAPRVVQDRGV